MRKNIIISPTKVQNPLNRSNITLKTFSEAFNTFNNSPLKVSKDVHYQLSFYYLPVLQLNSKMCLLLGFCYF